MCVSLWDAATGTLKNGVRDCEKVSAQWEAKLVRVARWSSRDHAQLRISKELCRKKSANDWAERSVASISGRQSDHTWYNSRCCQQNRLFMHNQSTPRLIKQIPDTPTQKPQSCFLLLFSRNETCILGKSDPWIGLGMWTENGRLDSRNEPHHFCRCARFLERVRKAFVCLV